MSEILLNKFKNELNIMGYSQRTIDTYMIYLNMFYEYVKKRSR
jgi:hypothetical protein